MNFISIILCLYFLGLLSDTENTKIFYISDIQSVAMV